jgi:TPR repeat protein
MLCSRCMSARYCNSACQRLDWNLEHFLICDKPRYSLAYLIGRGFTKQEYYNEYYSMTTDQLNQLANAGDEKAVTFPVWKAAMNKSSNCPSRIRLLQKSADYGCPLSQYKLYLHYVELGVKVEAKSLIFSSATCGLHEAQCILGAALLFGTVGFEIDLSESRRWHLRAADRGYRDSQYQIALFYERGQTLNPKKAFYWAKKSADQGYPKALTLLAMMFEYCT